MRKINHPGDWERFAEDAKNNQGDLTCLRFKYSQSFDCCDGFFDSCTAPNAEKVFFKFVSNDPRIGGAVQWRTSDEFLNEILKDNVFPFYVYSRVLDYDWL